MTETDKATVVLLPKTVDYYQIMLTRMLETERYAEAVDLLRFLLGCQPNDLRMLDEWKALLIWLESQFVQVENESVPDLNEADLLEEQVHQRLYEDDHYGLKLLEMLTQSHSFEKQMLALGQLAYINDETLDEPIKRWLEEEQLHPLIQFKAMQTLKLRHYEGKITIMRDGEPASIEIDDTPLSLEQFPRLTQMPLLEVQEVCEIHSPGLAYFAEQIWFEYLSCIYGTALYDELVRMEDEEVQIWAAALHFIVMSMSGMSSDEEQLELLQHYGLRDRDWIAWEKKCDRIRAVFGDRPETR